LEEMKMRSEVKRKDEVRRDPTTGGTERFAARHRVNFFGVGPLTEGVFGLARHAPVGGNGGGGASSVVGSKKEEVVVPAPVPKPRNDAEKKTGSLLTPEQREYIAGV
jgi:hypothetical protein